MREVVFRVIKRHNFDNYFITSRLLSKYEGFSFTPRDPSTLPKECPADMERIAHFVDNFKHPKLDCSLPLTTHIAKALEEILPKDGF